jgi:hypothetical protein
MGERPLCEIAYFWELRRFVPGVEGGTAMLTRPAPTTTTINAPLSHSPGLISFRLSLTGINPQIARHRGCNQKAEPQPRHLCNHA